MNGKYKVWMTQGQGCGERPDAEYDTLDEALDEAASMCGEGSVGIQLPDGSWHEFGEEWQTPVKVMLLRMRKDGLNPKQRWLLRQWHNAFGGHAIGKRIVENLQRGAHVFQEAFDWLERGLKHEEAERLFFNSLTWGLFDIFDCPTGMMPTEEQIDWLVEGRKG